MLNIKEFRSEIGTGGVLRTNRFMVSFASPRSLGSNRSTKNISLRCETVQWPGVSFSTMDAPSRFGYGASEVIPFAPIFQDVQCTFIVDKNSNLHKYFFDWMNAVMNLESRGQSNYGGGAYELGYKKDYTTDINIDVYRETGDVAMTATLFKAFPRSLPSFDLNWASNDEALKLNVEFTYTDFFIDYHLPTK